MIFANAIATQQGSFGVLVEMQDPETGKAVSPVTLTWTLTDSSKTVINSRQDVAVSITAGQEQTRILLEGADLQLLTGETSKRWIKRRLLIEATYHSQLGVSKPANELVYFYLENMYI